MLTSVFNAVKGVFNAVKGVSDKLGPVATVGGLLLIPFFLMASGNMVAAHAAAGEIATHVEVLTSFWAGLVTNPVTGEVGLGPGLSNMATGAQHLFGSLFNVLSSGFGAAGSGGEILASIQETLNLEIG